MRQIPLAPIGVASLLALLTGFLVFLFLPQPLPQSQVQEITRMWKWETGQLQSSGQWQTLPDYWNKKGQSGTWRYLGNFVLNAKQINKKETFSIYMPRAGNRLTIQVNNTPIAQLGQLANDQSDYSHQVHLLQIPQIALRTGNNLLHITVQGEKLRAAGLPIIQIGPTSALPSERLSPLLFSPPMTFGIVALAFVISCFSGFAFFRSRSKLYFLVTMVGISGAIHLCTLLFSSPKIDYHWWSLIFETSMFGFIISLGYFTHTALHLNRRWLNLITASFVICALILIPSVAFLRAYPAWRIWTFLALLYGWFITVSVCAAWWQQKNNKTAIALALASILACALGTIDHFNLFFSLSGFYKAYFLRFVLLIFLLSLGFVMLELRAQERLQEQTKHLRAQHQHALEKQHLQQQFLQENLALQNTIQKQERTRFMQNLHDSMGIQLQSLLALAEQEHPPNHRLIREIQLTIDQMRLIVNSLQDFDGSLTQLLGDIRYRIESRIDLFGASVSWENCIADSVLADSALAQTQNKPTPMASAYLQQIFYELTMNVIKHAQASLVQVSVQLTPTTLLISFSDNGIGYRGSPAVSVHSNHDSIGQRSIHHRVSELQGQVQWGTSLQGGTCCRMQFSVEKLCLTKNAYTAANS